MKIQGEIKLEFTQILRVIFKFIIYWDGKSFDLSSKKFVDNLFRNNKGLLNDFIFEINT
jgi:hypothetical protein